MAQDASELFIAGITGGRVWQAPRGTVVPDGLEAPAAGWTDLGYLSEDGHSLSEDTESEDIKVWPTTIVARSIVTGQTTEAKFSLAQWNADTLALRFGGIWTEDAISSVKTMKVPVARSFDHALIIDNTDGGRTYRYVLAKVSITGFEEIVHKTGEPSLLGMTVKILAATAVDWWDLRSDDPAIVVA
jgi:hypothetical protein